LGIVTAAHPWLTALYLFTYLLYLQQPSNIQTENITVSSSAAVPSYSCILYIGHVVYLLVL